MRSNPLPENILDSERIPRLGLEIEALVAQGAETTRFEFTVQCSLASNNRKSQVDFARTIQGIANCLPPDERAYVIGADQKNKCFCNVANAREFDAANIGQVLARYMEPVPNFISYPIVSKSGENYIAVFLPADQPRPIVAKATAQDDSGKTLLRPGEIWVKRNTALSPATRADLEAMYEIRTEVEAERRAQQRFAITRDTLEATFRIQSSPERQTPTEDLVLGPAANYEAYLEQLIASEDELRFRMLLTVLRRCLIEKWQTFNAYGSNSSAPAKETVEKLSEHITDVFEPSMRRLLHAGFILLEFAAPQQWFESVVKLLVAGFTAVTQLEALSEDTRKSLAIELIVGARLLATYALRMKRHDYLPSLLKQTVSPLGRPQRRKTEPFTFWPVRMNVPGHDRIAYAWEHATKPYWLRFFGSEKSFQDATSQLEFITALNADFGTQVPEARDWVAQFYPGLSLSYSSDLWRYSIQPCVPLVEEILQNVRQSPDMPFIINIAVLQGIFQMAFPREWQPQQRQDRFVQWIRDFEKWRHEAAVSMGRFLFDVDWGPVLSPLL